MIVGKWSTRALGELRPYDNDVLVFLKDGTGWIYQLNIGTWTFDTFKWEISDDGSISIVGVLKEINDDTVQKSEINIKNLQFWIDKMESGITRIRFSEALGSGHTEFGLETKDVPDLNKALTEEDRIHELIELLHWHTPMSIVNKVIEELKDIKYEYMHLLMQPIGKAYWDNAALALSRIDHEKLKDFIPDLLMWLHDLNWPGAQTVAGLLKDIGEPTIVHIKQILLGNDDTWSYWILSEVVNEWPRELVLQLKDELITRAARNSEEGIGDIAREILEKHHISE